MGRGDLPDPRATDRPTDRPTERVRQEGGDSNRRRTRCRSSPCHRRGPSGCAAARRRPARGARSGRAARPSSRLRAFASASRLPRPLCRSYLSLLKCPPSRLCHRPCCCPPERRLASRLGDLCPRRRRRGGSPPPPRSPARRRCCPPTAPTASAAAGPGRHPSSPPPRPPIDRLPCPPCHNRRSRSEPPSAQRETATRAAHSRRTTFAKRAATFASIQNFLKPWSAAVSLLAKQNEGRFCRHSGGS